MRYFYQKKRNPYNPNIHFRDARMKPLYRGYNNDFNTSLLNSYILTSVTIPHIARAFNVKPCRLARIIKNHFKDV